MSAKQREEVLCKLCGQQILLKNLKTHHERNHDITQTMGYTLVVDPKQKKLNFASKKIKLDNEETEPLLKNFNDLSEEEQSFEQSLILITGAKSAEQLKSFTKTYFNFSEDQFICIACGTTFQLNADDSTQWSHLKYGLNGT